MSSDQNDIVALQRTMLQLSLSLRMAKLARRCRHVWNDVAGLNAVLGVWLDRIPFSGLLYATDREGIQISGNVYRDGQSNAFLGQDLSKRPYFTGQDCAISFSLSEVYISAVTQRPCITAVQAVYEGERIMGYLAADFSLKDISLLNTTVTPMSGWRRIDGDPAISDSVPLLRRNTSEMDRRINDVLAIVDELMCERGIFHAKLHFSSSRATLWLMDDPHRYRIHVLEEISDPSICLAYGRRAYPGSAVVEAETIRATLDRFAELRFADPYLYLRSGSLNVINGMIGLTFSCDGSHYLPVDEFLVTDQQSWLIELSERYPAGFESSLAS